MPVIKSKIIRVKDAEGVWHDLPATVSEESFRAAERALQSETSAAASAAFAASSAGAASSSASDAATSAGAAASSATEAGLAKTETIGYAETAAAKASDAQSYAGDAQDAAAEAESYKDTAVEKAAAAALSEQNAAASASAASSSEAAAEGYAASAEADAGAAASSAGAASSSEDTATAAAWEASVSADVAGSFAEAAEAWATGGSSGTPSATNNAEYWASEAEDAAESVSASAAQIAQNAGDIAELKTQVGDINDVLFPEIAIDFSQAETKNGYMRRSDNKWIASSSGLSVFVSVPDGAQTIRVTANDTTYAVFAFLTSDAVTSSAVLPLCSETTIKTLLTGETENDAIPDDCRYLCFTFAYATTSGHEPDSAFFCWVNTIPQIDDTLTEQGEAADAKAVGDAIDALEAEINQIEPGLTAEAKQALLACFRHVAWIDHDQDYYMDLCLALYPEQRGLDHITAVFDPGQNSIYEFDSLDFLRQYLTVNAVYENGNTVEIDDYTLSGTLTVGTSAVTVTYFDKITTFNVSVSSYTEGVFINPIMETGSVSNYAYSPFAYKPVDGVNTYSYDGVIITAIELNFNSAGKFTLGRILDAEVVSGKVYQDDNVPMIPIHTFTVSGSGTQKLTLPTPVRLEAGYILTLGEPTDTATFIYGATSEIPNEGVCYIYSRSSKTHGWQITNTRDISVKVYAVQASQ